MIIQCGLEAPSPLLHRFSQQWFFHGRFAQIDLADLLRVDVHTYHFKPARGESSGDAGAKFAQAANRDFLQFSHENNAGKIREKPGKSRHSIIAVSAAPRDRATSARPKTVSRNSA